MQQKTFAAGEVIYRQGDPGHSLYVVEEGRVEVLREVGRQNLLMTVLGQGEIFGEMSLVLDMPRATTLRAAETTRLAILPKDAFLQLFPNDNPIPLALLRMLCKRLFDMGERVVGQHCFGEVARAAEVERIVLYPESPEMVSQIGLGGISVDIVMPFRIGGSSENEIRLQEVDGQVVSPSQFAIEQIEDRVVLHDLGSKLGTWVNNALIAHFEDSQFADLTFGENCLQIGAADSPFRFRLLIERTAN